MNNNLGLIIKLKISVNMYACHREGMGATLGRMMTGTGDSDGVTCRPTCETGL